MRPYFRLNKAGLALEAAGKRVPEVAPTYGTWMHRYRDALQVLRREACEECTKLGPALVHNAQLEQEERDFASGKARFKLSDKKWGWLRDSYLKAYGHLASQAPMRSQFKCWFDPAWEGIYIVRITSADCAALLAHAREEKQSEASVRQLHIRGRLVFKYAVDVLGELEANPWEKVPRPTLAKKRPVYLRKEQVDALLLSAGTFRLLLLMAVFTGARRGELAALRWTDIDFASGAHGLIHFRRSWGRDRAKGGREEVVPIHPTLRPYLLDAAKAAKDELLFPAPRKGGMRHSAWHTSELLKSIAKQAGVTLPEGCTFHSLRKTFGTHLAVRTGDVAATQRLLRHSSPVVTEAVYFGEDVAYLERAIAQLPAFGGEHKSDTMPSETAEGDRRVSENTKQLQTVGGSSLPRRRPSDFIFLLKERHSPLVSAGNSSGNAATYAAPAVSARPCWPPLRATVEHIPNTRRAA